MTNVVESDMTFGPYPEGTCFVIENSAIHKSAGEGVKIVEFVKLHSRIGKPPQLWLVEAKKSSPKANHEFEEFVDRMKRDGYERFPDQKQSVDEFIDYARNERLSSLGSASNNFEDYFSDIRDKMQNALGLYFACMLKRHNATGDDWPETFKELDPSTVGFRLLLVIKVAEEAWLPPLSEKFKKVLNPLVKTWGLGANSVEVLTEAGARKHGLITGA